MAERAGYTVTMFLIDVSPTMGETREVELPEGPNGEERSIEMTNLQWSLQYVKLKIQEMIYNGRKTDQCGIILFGTEESNNAIHEKDGGYEHVSEFIPIGQPNAGTLAKLNTLEPSTEIGDPIDAIIVGIETQDKYLAKKKTWTRKMVLLTDGRNPIEIEDWEATAGKMNDLSIHLIIVGIDFDDEEMSFEEEDKDNIKRANEKFFHSFVGMLDSGSIGNCELALEEVSRPDIKQVKSALMGHELRIGDPDNFPEEGTRLQVKTSKATAKATPKSWKRFAKLPETTADGDVIMKTVDEDGEEKVLYGELSRRTEYYFAEKQEDEESTTEDDDEDDFGEFKAPKQGKTIDKEELIRGFKYGASFVPCPDGSFPRLPTKKGIDICGFFPETNFRREQAMSEVTYIWADPGSPANQIALSSIVRGMLEKHLMAIARWVSKDGMDPKMGVLCPLSSENVDYFLWVQMPFADDVRKYTFASLDKLISKKGEKITKHAYIPTEEQQDVMDNFVDAMDLMEAGEKDEDGIRTPWYDTRLSYNPAIHRVKQAQFHGAVVQDINTHPLPPPHPELLKYFDPPRRVLKRAHSAIEECKKAFNVKQVPKRVVRARKDGHVHANDGEEMLLLDQVSKPAKKSSSHASPHRKSVSPTTKKRQPKKADSDSETEEEEEPEDLLLEQKPSATSKPESKRKPAKPDEPMTPPASAPDTQQEPDPGRIPGRIIGLTDPLGDFGRNVAVGDIVTKAVEDLAWAVLQIVNRPFASRRTDELLDCMKEMRKYASMEDEVELWNDFLRDLRRVCLEERPGNTGFWTQFQALGREMSLISSKDTVRSQVSEKEVEDFMAS
ncbi:ATP-dependent DNA helicase II subunit 2 [Steccherinum ochraceum]|uniref:ATP-dependent DNA helicase II subunit 2 n=1 Tax=Steccherinum ochraceum TaxID=92696 RepID=A0A4R0R3U4_9APHY|nr:ATP-dependent DNA helicase II subunit 2 [Steccherinum ochraceum]